VKTTGIIRIVGVAGVTGAAKVMRVTEAAAPAARSNSYTMVSGVEIVSTPRPGELWRNLDSSGITYNELDGEGMLFAPFYFGFLQIRPP